MHKDYTKYSADQLLNDDYFLQSELHPTEESRLFWQNLMEENEPLAAEIEIARLLLNALEKDTEIPSLTSTEENTLWQQIEQTNIETERKNRRSRIIREVLSIAATITLLFAVGWYMAFEPKKQGTDYLAIIESINIPDSASQKVQLILDNNEKMDLEGDEAQLEYKKEGQVNVNSKKVELEKQESTQPAYNQLVVPVGKRSSVTFSDGTKIWVNSDTKVVYPVAFANEKREIFVEGEIFLEVSHDAKRPFIVKTKQMEIKVLGTKFNVSAYKNENNMQVVLVEGKVEVNTDNKNKSLLAPNQMFHYDGRLQKGKISTVDINDYVAWKDGYYQFHHESLNVILRKLSRYYGTLIYCDNTDNDLSCSGKLDLKDNLEDVLHSLKRAIPLEIENKNESIKINVKH